MMRQGGTTEHWYPGTRERRRQAGKDGRGPKAYSTGPNQGGDCSPLDEAWVYDSFHSGDLKEIERLFQESLDVVNATLGMERDELMWASSGIGLWSLEYKRELTNPLCITASRGYTDCLRYLLHRRADPNTAPGGRSPLHEACAGGHTECAELLLEHRANPNLLSSEGLAPLHLCCSEDTLRCAKLLIQYGAAVGQASEDTQETPLHVASRQGLPAHALLYLRYGAAVNSRNAQHETPLIAACGNAAELKHQGNYLQVCRLLLTHGADANATDEEKKSPLHKACKNASHGLVGLLLDNGADVNAIDYNGASPLSCVLQTATFKQEMGPQHAVRALLNHGSRRVCPTAFGKVLQTCASVPQVIEILFNSYDYINISDRWMDSIPDEIFQTRQSFYESLLQVSTRTRSLQHLCRCVIRKHFGSRCQCLIPQLSVPTSLQEYLLLRPEGSVS